MKTGKLFLFTAAAFICILPVTLKDKKAETQPMPIHMDVEKEEKQKAGTLALEEPLQIPGLIISNPIGSSNVTNIPEEKGKKSVLQNTDYKITITAPLHTKEQINNRQIVSFECQQGDIIYNIEKADLSYCMSRIENQAEIYEKHYKCHIEQISTVKSAVTDQYIAHYRSFRFQKEGKEYRYYHMLLQIDSTNLLSIQAEWNSEAFHDEYLKDILSAVESVEKRKEK